MTVEYHKLEEFQIRSRKLAEIRSLGVEPYPHKYVHTKKAAQVILEMEGKTPGHFEEAEKEETESVIVSGRLVLFRAMGKNAFGHIQDETGRIQILCSRDHTQVTGLHSADVTAMKFIEK